MHFCSKNNEVRELQKTESSEKVGVDILLQQLFISLKECYKVASIRVNPMHAAKNVCPTPQINAYSGSI